MSEDFDSFDDDFVKPPSKPEVKIISKIDKTEVKIIPKIDKQEGKIDSKTLKSTEEKKTSKLDEIIKPIAKTSESIKLKDDLSKKTPLKLSIDHFFDDENISGQVKKESAFKPPAPKSDNDLSSLNLSSLKEPSMVDEENKKRQRPESEEFKSNKKPFKTVLVDDDSEANITIKTNSKIANVLKQPLGSVIDTATAMQLNSFSSLPSPSNRFIQPIGGNNNPLNRPNNGNDPYSGYKIGYPIPTTPSNGISDPYSKVPPLNRQQTLMSPFPSNDSSFINKIAQNLNSKIMTNSVSNENYLKKTIVPTDRHSQSFSQEDLVRETAITSEYMECVKNMPWMSGEFKNCYFEYPRCKTIGKVELDNISNQSFMNVKDNGTTCYIKFKKDKTYVMIKDNQKSVLIFPSVIKPESKMELICHGEIQVVNRSLQPEKVDQSIRTNGFVAESTTIHCICPNDVILFTKDSDLDPIRDFNGDESTLRPIKLNGNLSSRLAIWYEFFIHHINNTMIFHPQSNGSVALQVKAKFQFPKALFNTPIKLWRDFTDLPYQELALKIGIDENETGKSVLFKEPIHEIEGIVFSDPSGDKNPMKYKFNNNSIEIWLSPLNHKDSNLLPEQWNSEMKRNGFPAYPLYYELKTNTTNMYQQTKSSKFVFLGVGITSNDDLLQQIETVQFPHSHKRIVCEVDPLSSGEFLIQRIRDDKDSCNTPESIISCLTSQLSGMNRHQFIAYMESTVA
jgi:hypothetical protein